MEKFRETLFLLYSRGLLIVPLIQMNTWSVRQSGTHWATICAIQPQHCQLLLPATDASV